MSLADEQNLLRKLIAAPTGVVDGLSMLEPRDRDLWDGLVRGDDRMAAVERVDVYANMYFFRLRDCLRDDFGTLHAVVGDENFHNLITDYLLVHPPTHFSLRYAGRHLPDFVSTHSLRQQWEVLPELARLEWAVLEAFDAPGAQPLTAAELHAISPENWGDLRFKTTASLQRLDLQWPVHLLWERVQSGGAPGEIAPAPTLLRIWRCDLQV
ncbi:MAG TPA: DNA-binding domain-containing protein [Candidatus Acidoferrales bacterium]|nr:DNA-binding domain-containing protein [Candidatus Acidoferrales bacterium]